MGESSINEEKVQLLAKIQATLDFLPNDPEAAETVMPWLCWQLEAFFEHLTLGDLRQVEAVALVGLLGVPFARFLDALPPEADTRVHLRAV